MRKFIYIFLLFSLTANAQDTILDCFGTVAPTSWLGDGFCDDGSYTWNGNVIDFNCEEFGYDAEDCPLPIDTIPGCMDMLALNYVPEANFNDGSCEYPVFGCIDPASVNYNPLAEVDDGSCANVACADGEAKMLFEVTLDQYPGETGWILTDISNGQPVASVMPGEYSYDQANTTIPYEFCVPETGVELILSDTYGDGMAGSLWGGSDGNFIILADLEPCGSPDVIWELPDPNFGGAAYSGPIWLEHCDIPIEYGCTDSGYIEFNPNAQVDDGSCETEHIVGCINWTAYNYNPEATLNHIVPVCEYRLVIEDDAADGWGDSHIAVTQGDSLIGIYSMEPGEYDTVFFINLRTDIPVQIRYFETGPPQVPQEELEFQTMHNSFFLFNENVDLLISGGAVPFANNGAGALQPFEPPFWHVYNAMPYCGDYCIPTVEGCMNQSAFNYNPEANTDIGNCIPIIEGCTNELAFNYDSSANVDDGSCDPYIYGCMDIEAWNYNSLANVADESCLYFGCTDELALNYDSTANVNNDNCIYPIPGCTNPDAFNFEVDANVDDGSCIPVLIGCMDPTMFNYNDEANTASDNCIPFIFGCTDTTAFNYDPVANTDNGSCIAFYYGCTDPSAFNYNPEANTEDFSCVDIVYGCTDNTAFNYDSLANTDNGGCIDVLEGCMDPLAYNYDAVYNTDDGSCLYDAGCIDGPGIPYWLNDTCYAWVIMIDPYCCNDQWDDKCQELYWSCGGNSSLNINELMEDNAIILYPNPTEDIINITSKETFELQVFDILGNRVIYWKVESNGSTKTIKVDISLLASGIYNFNIIYNNNVITKKVIKK